MIRRVTVQGFKCLRDVTVDLGPFNVLVGDNDSGKSSFLQALAVAPVLGRGELHPRVITAARAEHFLLSVVGTEGELMVWGGKESDTASRPSAFSKGGTVMWQTGGLSVIRVGTTFGTTISSPVIFDPERIASPSPQGTGELSLLLESRGGGTTAHLARLALGDRARYEAILEALVAATDGRIREYVVGEPAGGAYPLSFRLSDGTLVPAHELSQGLLVYLAFLALVHRDDAPNVLLVEEPERGLHPLRLQELVGLLRTLTTRGTQLIITTHSPEVLSACSPEEVRVFLRPKPGDGTIVKPLPKDFERIAMRETLGQIWASRGEEGLLDMLPPATPVVRAEA